MRIRIATVVTLLAIAGVVYAAIARFADAGQLTAAKWNVFHPAVRAIVPVGRAAEHPGADGDFGCAGPAARRALRTAAAGPSPGSALDRHCLCRSVPLGAVAVAGADVRVGAATARDQPADLLEDLRADRAVQRRGARRDLPGGRERPTPRPIGSVAGRRPDLLAGDAAGHLPAVDPTDHPVAGHAAGVVAQGLDVGLRGKLPGTAADRQRVDRQDAHT